MSLLYNVVVKTNIFIVNFNKIIFIASLYVNAHINPTEPKKTLKVAPFQFQ